MSDIPFTNGRYVDIAATTTQSDLRILGQKDLQAGHAYAWIDNRQDTWRTTVDGQSIPATRGIVRIALQTPSATYNITWYNTQTGQLERTETHTADATGVVELNITNLQTDRAMKISRATKEEG